MARLGKALKGASRARESREKRTRGRVGKADQDLADRLLQMQEADYLRRLAATTKRLLKVRTRGPRATAASLGATPPPLGRPRSRSRRKS
jgi:hypothetical protein